MGQQAPGTATTEDIEDGIHDLALRIFLRSPTGLGSGDEMLNQRPFTIPEVSRRRVAGFHAPIVSEMITQDNLIKHTLRGTQSLGTAV
jgi:hypothetical protein